MEGCGNGAILLLSQSWSLQEQQPTFTSPRYVATATRKPQRHKHLRRPSQMDGDSSQPSIASSRRSRRDAALCLTTNQPSTTSARKNSLRRARGNTRVRRTNVIADPECGDFAGDERGATNIGLSIETVLKELKNRLKRWMSRLQQLLKPIMSTPAKSKFCSLSKVAARSPLTRSWRNCRNCWTAQSAGSCEARWSCSHQP